MPETEDEKPLRLPLKIPKNNADHFVKLNKFQTMVGIVKQYTFF